MNKWLAASPGLGSPRSTTSLRGQSDIVQQALAGHRRSLGRFGEDVAASYLRRRGARLLGRNVRAGRGEVDLHVRIGKTVVAVEVKTIDGGHGDRAVHQVTPRKAAAMAASARRLRPRPERVDLIEVVVSQSRVDIRWTKAVA